MTQPMFDTLYHDYYNLVVDKAMSILKKPEDAEEVTNDVFMKLNKQLSKNDSIDNIKAWLFTTARNRAVDIVRMREVRKESAVTDFPLVSIPDTNTNIEDDIIGNESVGIIKDSIKMLGDNKRARVFRMCVFDGHSYNEAADIMGCTVGTIKTHMHQCRKQLSDLLEKNLAGFSRPASFSKRRL